MQKAERPLSPHLSVYRFKYTLLTSISNRITGLALSVALLPLVYWLHATARGPEAYEEARHILEHPVSMVLLAAILVAFVYHLVAGIRHLIWDTGHGLEREQAKSSSWIIGFATVVLALLLGYLIFFRGGLTQ
jgi:succinate dehydrogenase / fumarate reductase, cytochrome b subunit